MVTQKGNPEDAFAVDHKKMEILLGICCLQSSGL